MPPSFVPGMLHMLTAGEACPLAPGIARVLIFITILQPSCAGASHLHALLHACHALVTRRLLIRYTLFARKDSWNGLKITTVG